MFCQYQVLITDVCDELNQYAYQALHNITNSLRGICNNTNQPHNTSMAWTHSPATSDSTSSEYKIEVPTTPTAPCDGLYSLHRDTLEMCWQNVSGSLASFSAVD